MSITSKIVLTGYSRVGTDLVSLKKKKRKSLNPGKKVYYKRNSGLALNIIYMIIIMNVPNNNLTKNYDISVLGR